ncbi:MAG: Methyltransferase type 11 [Bryobacterales bacterium]|nr:Methyltransferase type 11 [Bryobacterales bacterium]
MTTLAPIDAYRLLAQDYDASPNPLLALEQRTMRSLFPSLPGARVVDVAAGTGRWASYCRAQGAQTIAMDFCPEMLTSAPEPVVLADANQLPLPDAIADVTICAFALGYAPACLPELARVTRNGGTVLVSDVHPEAIRRGWTRSFRHGSEVIGVAHHLYNLDDLFAMDLRLDCLIEPRFGEPERAVFAKAGKLAAFEEAAREPAIFVARWIKIG